jgi:acetate kinase
MPDYILALNCGSSSIKSKLYRLPLAATREPEASLSISNIGAEDANVQVKLLWNGHRIPTDVELKGDAADCG